MKESDDDKQEDIPPLCQSFKAIESFDKTIAWTLY